MANNGCDIKFSILIPVYNVEIHWLERAIESVVQQQYSNWELCIVDDCSTDESVKVYLRTIRDSRIKIKYQEKNGGISEATNEAAAMANGEYLVLMDNDDEISQDALLEFAKAISKSNADIIYSDQDIVDTEGNHREPYCKPDWSPDLLLSQMYVGHLLGFKRTLFEQMGGFRSEYNGSQDYDLILRMSEVTDKIVHVPKILYSWRAIPTSTANNPESKPYAQIVGKNAIQSHLDRVYGMDAAVALETENYFVYDVRYKIKTHPLVSVIIPTKDHVELLSQAVGSILQFTKYDRYEIIILDNNSEKTETFRYFDQITAQCENIHVITAAFEFNWSKLNNFGMKHAKGDVYIFLNNDVEISSGEWMYRLVEKVMLPEIGIVGALLLYEDNTIQHAGVVAGMGGWADHVYKGMRPVHYGSPYVSPMVTRNVTAVTGACMAVSKETIKAIGTFDEDFIICGSDVELCIRAVHCGFRNIYDPYVRLYHFESKTRDSYIPDVDFELSKKMYKSYLSEGDPYYNIQLDRNSCVPKIRNKNEAVKVENKVIEEYIGYIDEKNLHHYDSGIDTHIAEINPYIFRKSLHEEKRINILLPSINPEHVFGGISTALKFFDKLAEETGFDKRIILVDAVPSKEAIEKYKKHYTFVKWDEDSSAKDQIVPYSERNGWTLPVSDQDYFMFTGWWTAHCAQEAFEEFEEKTGIGPKPFINFIQDYEPGFYAWSTRYLLADATYKHPYRQIAIFNTRLLQDYFHQQGYSFYKEFSFDPVLNTVLKEKLYETNGKIRKKKQLLVYGRPGTDRNAFKLVIAALRKWVEIYENPEEWILLSAGEMHPDVYLGKGMYLHSVGKLTLDEYAQMLEETFAGISLMASPHPSYPPLEMSVFGVKVVTNTFANKDLSRFNDFIVSLNNISPNNIARHLNKICDDYRVIIENRIVNQDYCENENVFSFIEQIKELL